MRDIDAKKTLRRIFIENLIAGIGWALGLFLGTTVLVGLIGLVLSRVQTIPVIGNFIYNVTQEIEKNEAK